MSDLKNTIAALLGNTDPMPFGVGGPAEPAVAAPQFVTDAIDDAVALPKRTIEASKHWAQTGEFDPAPYVDTALTLGGAGAPMAEKGAVGMFGGRLSPAADHRALQEAERMAAGGKYRDNIWRDTGWGLSPLDNKWRFEVPDDRMRLKYMPLREGDRATGSVEAFVHHPDLYKAYPNIGHVQADVTKDSRQPLGSGLFGNSGPSNAWPTAYVVAPNSIVGNSVMGHELQHFLQRMEGFAPGITPSYYAKRWEHGMLTNPERWGKYDYNEVKRLADDQYHRTAGEVEARNVQARLKMTPAERRDIPPWYTQDVPYQDQILFDPLTETVKALRRK